MIRLTSVIVFLLAGGWGVWTPWPAEAQNPLMPSPSQIRPPASKEQFKAVLRPLWDDGDIALLGRSLPSMGKTQLEMFADIVSSCVSGDEDRCQKRGADYEVRYSGPIDVRVVKALGAARAQAQPNPYFPTDTEYASKSLRHFYDLISPHLKAAFRGMRD